VATIAQTTTPAPTPVVPTARTSGAARVQHHDDGADLTWIFAGIAAAALLGGGYLARRRLRNVLR
jgi:hypothetical protein